MSDIEIMLARIEERLIANQTINETAHKTIYKEIKQVKNYQEKMNGSLRKTITKVAVLEDENNSTKWTTRTLGAAFAGGVISKFMGLW